MGTVPSSPLLYTHPREKKKRTTKEKEHTHTKPQPLSGVVEAGGCWGQDHSPNPTADAQAGGAYTKGKPWTAALDLETATEALTCKVPG